VTTLCVGASRSSLLRLIEPGQVDVLPVLGEEAEPLGAGELEAWRELIGPRTQEPSVHRGSGSAGSALPAHPVLTKERP
jgi:hypothetical protein